MKHYAVEMGIPTCLPFKFCNGCRNLKLELTSDDDYYICANERVCRDLAEMLEDRRMRQALTAQKWAEINRQRKKSK